MKHTLELASNEKIMLFREVEIKEQEVIIKIFWLIIYDLFFIKNLILLFFFINIYFVIKILSMT